MVDKIENRRIMNGTTEKEKKRQILWAIRPLFEHYCNCSFPFKSTNKQYKIQRIFTNTTTSSICVCMRIEAFSVYIFYGHLKNVNSMALTQTYHRPHVPSSAITNSTFN